MLGLWLDQLGRTSECRAQWEFRELMPSLRKSMQCQWRWFPTFRQKLRLSHLLSTVYAAVFPCSLFSSQFEYLAMVCKTNVLCIVMCPVDTLGKKMIPPNICSMRQKRCNLSYAWNFVFFWHLFIYIFMCPSVQSFKNHYVYGCLDCMSLPEPCVCIALRSEGVGSPRTGV